MRFGCAAKIVRADHEKARPAGKNGEMSSHPQFPIPGNGTQHPGSMYPVYTPIEMPPSEPLPYHRLARTYPAYRWWKTVMVGLIALGLYVGLMVVATLVFVVASLANAGFDSSWDGDVSALESVDMTDPGVFAFAMVSLILLLPALFIATRIMNVQKLGTLTSVRGTMRWGWLGTCAAVAFGVIALSFGISSLLDGIQGYPFAPDFTGPNMWTLLILTFLLVPFQAAAEEYVFRGYFMQMLGGWFRHPAYAILLPIPFFVVGHDYDIYGRLDVGLFALAAGWLTWRTGGLEAAIALHVVNNVAIFAMGAIGLADVNATEGSPGGLLVSILTTSIFVFAVVKLANHRNIERLSPALRA